MAAYVYILRSKSGRYYVGSTSDLDRRLEQHKRGHTHTTQRMNGAELVFYQEVETLGIARKAERKIKSWKRKDYIDRIVMEQSIAFLDK